MPPSTSKKVAYDLISEERQNRTVLGSGSRLFVLAAILLSIAGGAYAGYGSYATAALNSKTANTKKLVEQKSAECSAVAKDIEDAYTKRTAAESQAAWLSGMTDMQSLLRSFAIAFGEQKVSSFEIVDSDNRGQIEITFECATGNEDASAALANNTNKLISLFGEAGYKFVSSDPTASSAKDSCITKIIFIRK